MSLFEVMIDGKPRQYGFVPLDLSKFQKALEQKKGRLVVLRLEDETTRTRKDNTEIHGLYEVIANHFRRFELGWSKADVESYCKDRFRARYRITEGGFSRAKREWEMTQDEASEYKRDIVDWMRSGFPNEDGEVGFVPPLFLEDGNG